MIYPNLYRSHMQQSMESSSDDRIFSRGLITSSRESGVAHPPEETRGFEPSQVEHAA